jgi:hypothetical protein
MCEAMVVTLEEKDAWGYCFDLAFFPIARAPRQVPPPLTNFTHDFDSAFNNANREPFPLRVSTSWKLSNDVGTHWSHLSTSEYPLSLLLFYLLCLSVFVLSHLLQHAYTHTHHLFLYLPSTQAFLSTLFPHNLTSSLPSISTTYWVGTLRSRWVSA